MSNKNNLKEKIRIVCRERNYISLFIIRTFLSIFVDNNSFIIPNIIISYV